MRYKIDFLWTLEMIKNYHTYPAKLALSNSFVQNESVSRKLEFLVNLLWYQRWWSKSCGKTIVLHLKCHCVFQQVARTPVIRFTFIEKVSDLNLKLKCWNSPRPRKPGFPCCIGAGNSVNGGAGLVQWVAEALSIYLISIDLSKILMSY